MSLQRDSLADVVSATRQIMVLVRTAPPHVRPWLRGVEAEAQHVRLEVESAHRKASARFLTWLFAGLADDGEEEAGDA